MTKKAKWMDDLYDEAGGTTAALEAEGVPMQAAAAKYARCYESHKPLTIDPINGIVVYGGSCAFPVVKDADIYVGFDLSMAKSDKSYPWVEGESVLFPIPDMGVPKDKVAFAEMIDWIAVQLTAKHKVHLGCIGGHGRTGTVLAALYSVMTGEKDAIKYVRDNYCVKAVESKEQVDFLHNNFGITKQQPAKSGWANNATVTNTGGRWSDAGVWSPGGAQAKFPKKGAYEIVSKPKAAGGTPVQGSTENMNGPVSFKPMKSNSSLLGPNVQLTK